MSTFNLTEDHLKLLRRANVGWDGCEFGAPSIDCKRPYGNSDVVRDICKILGWDYQDPDDADDDERDAKATKIHKELETALQIVLLHIGKPMPIGKYGMKRDYCFDSWEYIG